MKSIKKFFVSFSAIVSVFPVASIADCDISGQWLIQQGNYRGILHLTQSGANVSGSMDWDKHPDALIEKGTYSNSRFEIVLGYSGGLKGTYKAVVDASCKRMVNGVAESNQGGSANWTATRLSEDTSVDNQKSVVNINPVSNYSDYLIYQNCQPPNLAYSYFVNQHGDENFQPVSIKNLVLNPDKYIVWVYGGRRAFVRVGAMIGNQKTLIEAAVSDDKTCYPKPAVFTVPIGMLATGFYVERLESGVNCDNYSPVLERGYYICRVNPGTGTGTDANTNAPHCPQGMTRNAFADGCVKIKMGPSTYNPDQEPIGADPADLPPLPKN